MADNGSDFVEEPYMIAGSHSCTLDRLYAWERELYDVNVLHNQKSARHNIISQFAILHFNVQIIGM